MTNTLRVLIIVLVLLALAGLAYYAVSERDAAAPGSGLATTTDSAAIDEEAAEKPKITWIFTAAEIDMPRTHVRVAFEGTTHTVGTFDGSCAELTTDQLQENEVSGILCWWAGAGTEIGIFHEGDAYVLRKGVQEEPTAETEGFRGDFETILELN